MNQFFGPFLFLLIASISSAQSSQHTINEKDVERVEIALSADSMQGRKAFTPGSEKAANFISEEFRRINLQQGEGSTGYKQTFSIISPRRLSIFASFAGQSVDTIGLMAFTCQPDLNVTS